MTSFMTEAAGAPPIRKDSGPGTPALLTAILEGRQCDLHLQMCKLRLRRVSPGSHTAKKQQCRDANPGDSNSSRACTPSHNASKTLFLVTPGPSLPFKQVTPLLTSSVLSYNHWLRLPLGAMACAKRAETSVGAGTVISAPSGISST